MSSYIHPSGASVDKEGSAASTNDTYHAGPDERMDVPLADLKAAKSWTISPELFEKMYLSPQTQVKGDLRKTFGNPTPLGLLGYLLSLSPLACDLLGWRGAGGANASIGAYYFIGGLFMFTSGMMEFILGNTFSFIVFCTYGGYWFALGATFTPFFYAYGAYSTNPADGNMGLQSNTFQASFGFFTLFMAVVSFIFLICSIRTNITFIIIFLGLFMIFVFETAQYWMMAQDLEDAAHRMQIAAGVWSFLCCLAGWYIFLSQMLQALDFPFELPVGDLSHVIKSATQRREAKEAKERYAV
ncbi:MAG: hypothetical protein M1832_006473 [Thelocarpon impressellum]|nr:MAG: hypothetical protein M1832_006473 [Thelocarpon impressellum]